MPRRAHLSFVRPFTLGYEKQYSEGDLLFVKRGEHSNMNVVANLPVLRICFVKRTKNGILRLISVEKLQRNGTTMNSQQTGYGQRGSNGRDLNINVRLICRSVLGSQRRTFAKRRTWPISFIKKTSLAVTSGIAMQNPNGIREPMDGGLKYFGGCANNGLLGFNLRR